MEQREKIGQLRREIERALLPLIDRDYVLFGLPYYNNIGDTLIWEGELSLLNQVPYRCIGQCGWNKYPETPITDKNTLILITGGGYMGDTWPKAWMQVLDCLQKNPQNKIILLPNTLYYADRALAAADAEILNRCEDLTLCMRDSRSMQLAREYFPDVKSILVPDMAFCINPDYLNKWKVTSSGKDLLLKRLDKELSDTPIPDALAGVDCEVRDWPTMERLLDGEKWFLRVLRRVDRLGNRFPSLKSWRDSMYKIWYRPMMTKIGVEFVSSYEKIYTTRLHVMILSILLGKEVYLIDNSYGKLSTFYHTWLEDCQDTHISQQ